MSKKDAPQPVNVIPIIGYEFECPNCLEWTFTEAKATPIRKRGKTRFDLPALQCAYCEAEYCFGKIVYRRNLPIPQGELTHA